MLIILKFLACNTVPKFDYVSNTAEDRVEFDQTDNGE